jgi:hypothetical protein
MSPLADRAVNAQPRKGRGEPSGFLHWRIGQAPRVTTRFFVLENGLESKLFSVDPGRDIRRRPLESTT